MGGPNKRLHSSQCLHLLTISFIMQYLVKCPETASKTDYQASQSAQKAQADHSGMQHKVPCHGLAPSQENG